MALIMYILPRTSLFHTWKLVPSPLQPLGTTDLISFSVRVFLEQNWPSALVSFLLHNMVTWDYLLIFLLFFAFLQPNLRQMEVARQGVKSKSQLPGYTTATPDPTTCVTYTSARLNARSLTPWVRPGIKPTSSRNLLRFLITEPRGELPHLIFYDLVFGIELTICTVLVPVTQQSDSLFLHTPDTPFAFRPWGLLLALKSHTSR